jgi:hypothetical protein
MIAWAGMPSAESRSHLSVGPRFDSGLRWLYVNQLRERRREPCGVHLLRLCSAPSCWIMILDKASAFPQDMLTHRMFTSPEVFAVDLLITPVG